MRTASEERIFLIRKKSRNFTPGVYPEHTRINSLHFLVFLIFPKTSEVASPVQFTEEHLNKTSRGFEKENTSKIHKEQLALPRTQEGPRGGTARLGSGG